MTKLLHLSNICASSMIALEKMMLNQFFPSLTMLLKTYAMIPVTMASVERSFSKLKLIKTVLRNRCGEKRLSDLMLLSIEREIPIHQRGRRGLQYAFEGYIHDISGRLENDALQMRPNPIDHKQRQRRLTLLALALALPPEAKQSRSSNVLAQQGK
ncbi:hypothetical protein N1851_024607 [Merluccius polli]|uniref:HAT C-terminal dimerisation domain-containing protein n=1 Tax=Merluccius polli TaxID=89951 RepID=A0AA47MEJ8_MERPO|nr:hypothetical protein N1851_024607 [Merluccius polli]